MIRDTLVDVDDEDTLEEEEKLEADEDHGQEISALAEEGKCTSTSLHFTSLHFKNKNMSI